jgi:hypothetical protein
LAELIRQVKHLLFCEVIKIAAAVGLRTRYAPETPILPVWGCRDAARLVEKVTSSSSPGGTSFDEFRDFEERGEAFKKWVFNLSCM